MNNNIDKSLKELTATATRIADALENIAALKELEAGLDDDEDYEAWSVKELKEELRDLELPTNGTKAELVDRLRNL
ncbi:MAG: SAP domain-containing protein [Candidatus Poseidoniia archaeon]|jgi:hypothetical protein|nr:SAP domain-containing protein [Candidatus Poseidoniia archaeon]